jgi:hypothetical protein
VESWNDFARHEAAPNSYPGLVVRVGRKKMRAVVRELLEELAEYSGLVERLPFVVKGRYHAARVKSKKRWRFIVRNHFNVLVLNPFLLQHHPDTLDKWTEPTGIELQVLFR